jgi:hypothetical protein
MKTSDLDGQTVDGASLGRRRRGNGKLGKEGKQTKLTTFNKFLSAKFLRRSDSKSGKNGIEFGHYTSGLAKPSHSTRGVIDTYDHMIIPQINNFLITGRERNSEERRRDEWSRRPGAWGKGWPWTP